MKQVETTREAIINRRSVRKYKTDMIQIGRAHV